MTSSTPSALILEKLNLMRRNIQRVIRGKDAQVELTLTALLARGHLLLEDVPGVGKTMLALALARSVEADFKRIQFTNDTVPGDILGAMVYSRQSESFRFVPGPIFAGILLADEINRASPKTQSALLEAMAERKVTVENQTYEVPKPFFVIATQNPLDSSGVFPLPESQLDRFLMRLGLGYPEPEAEREILLRDLSPDAARSLNPVVTTGELAAAMQMTRSVRVEDTLLDYILELAAATRRHPRLAMGVSPRAALMLKQAAQALALLRGRSFVLPDDLKALIPHVFGHRLSLKGEGSLNRREEIDRLLSEMVRQIPVPV